MYQETVLGVVVTLADICGYYQDSKSVDLMGALSKMKPKDVVVERNGKRETLEPAKLVPGDFCEHLVLASTGCSKAPLLVFSNLTAL